MTVSKRHEFKLKDIVAGAIVAALLSACQFPQAVTPAAPTPTPTSEPPPFITIVPERTTPGGPLAVIGSDWLPGEEVTIGLLSTIPTASGSIVLAILNADQQGRFQLNTSVPMRVIPGVWQVYAQTRTAGRFAAATLTVLDANATATAVPTATSATQPTRQPPQPTPTATRFIPPTFPPPQPTLRPPPTPLPPFTDWRGDYFNNPNLFGAPVLVRNDPTINFNWGSGSPDPRIPPDNFSVLWTRTLSFDFATYRFQFRVDDGVRMYVDNVLVLDDWRDGPARDVFTDLTLSGTRFFRVEYYERTGNALISLGIFRVQPVPPTAPPPNTPTSTPVPTAPPPPTVPPPPTFTPIPLPTQAPPPPLPTPTPIPPRTPTPTPIPLSTATVAPLPTATATATKTQTPMPSNTPTVTSVPLPTSTAATIPVPATSTATATTMPATSTATATATTAPTNIPLPTATNTDLPPTATATATQAPTDVPTATPTLEPTATATEAPPTETPTEPPPTETPTETPTEAPPTETPTLTPTTEATESPTVTPTSTPTTTVTNAVTATLNTRNLRLRVTGANWPRGEALTISLSDNAEGDNAVEIETVTVNRQGRFNVTATLPQAPPGPVWAVVTDEAGERVIVPVAQTR
jgi:hypothetical protein